MRISKASLVTPGANGLYGTAAIALSLFVFAYSTRFGPTSILFYYGLWFPLILVDYRKVLGSYGKYLWIFAFAVFACVSMFWSAAPGVTLRASIQYLSHIVCALIAMRTIDIRTLARGTVVGVTIVLLYSLLFGIYHYDPLDGTYSFVGAFASKNQLGFYASLGVYFAFVALFTLGERGMWIAAALGAAAISAYSLFASQSATSIITAVAIIALGLGMRAIAALRPANRQALFLAISAFGGIAAVALIYGGALDIVLGAFGKNSTLTGRTYLWQEGIEAAKASPIFGIGYQAYWVQGFSEAERLWEEFYITARSGFHFHNTYIETAVETGLIGLVLLSLVLLMALFGQLKRVLSAERHVEAMVLFCISVLLLIRSFVEVDILNSYHVGSFLLYFTAGKLTIVRRQPLVTWIGPARSHPLMGASSLHSPHGAR
ncbi:exopolysaccharide production protein ExoQ [Sinorhizobium kostiense]|uniref:Exopolysaccharide production protein ExoQ n=1 Tax=Sinorhizobium kostiense TaxID=76747 RepID=A0ABS4QSB4_9HYPH|nr:O-antigen ligase [Sinorhizobium kostiense]MBP2233541.1 exopolysaccharide production protein ExoQ [Sinorhizobium kostiense]